MIFKLLQISVIGAIYAFAQKQERLGVQYGTYDNYDSGLSNPVHNLSTLSTTQFTTLSHPAFPKYGVRIKQLSNLCNDTAKAYTGYIDIEARHLFFSFFESRSEPHKDDVILWIHGGPGCASSVAVFMESGPCMLTDDSGPKWRSESWTSNANVFFLDQPIGVGFSYAEYGEIVDTTEEAAVDVAAFVAMFFEHFNQFKGRAFHIIGESYAGRYIPVFATEIYDQNAKLIEAGMTPINLSSIMIGNGYTDFYTLATSYFDMTCTPASLPPVLNIATCVRMKQAVPRCKKWMKSSCVDQFDAMNCRAAMDFCHAELFAPVFLANKSIYDLSQDCSPADLDKNLCFPIMDLISSYFDRPEVRVQLGVDASVTSNFSVCSASVEKAFSMTMDEYRPTYNYVAALLERNVSVLIWVGTYDWICNHVANEAWTLNLDWSGKEPFSTQPLRSWYIDGKSIGKTRSANGLTYATLEGAGHLVPYNKPKEALEMVQRWLARKDL